MTSNVESQIPHRTKIGVLPLLGGILGAGALVMLRRKRATGNAGA